MDGGLFAKAAAAIVSVSFAGVTSESPAPLTAETLTPEPAAIDWIGHLEGRDNTSVSAGEDAAVNNNTAVGTVDSAKLSKEHEAQVSAFVKAKTAEEALAHKKEHTDHVSANLNAKVAGDSLTRQRQHAEGETARKAFLS